MQEVRCSSHRATIKKSPLLAGFFIFMCNKTFGEFPPLELIPLTVRFLLSVENKMQNRFAHTKKVC